MSDFSAQQSMEMRMALNAQIMNVGHQAGTIDGTSPPRSGATTPTQQGSADYLGGGGGDDGGIVDNTPVKAHTKRVQSGGTEWSAVAGGTFQEHWPSHLPRPPSRRRLAEGADGTGSNGGPNSNAPGVIVFNANTQEGSSMVRVLSEKGLRVNAVVRVFTSRNAKKLSKLKGVTLKIADLNDLNAVKLAAQGCQQAFLVTKYWERFENSIEENMAKVVLDASSQVGIKRLVLATFEDTLELRCKGRKSQIMPTIDGYIYPKFEGMESIDLLAKSLGIQVTHMMTSFLDEQHCKKSLILIRGENNKIIAQPYVQEIKTKD